MIKFQSSLIYQFITFGFYRWFALYISQIYMFVLMFEFIYYVSVIWQVKLDFDGGLSYWVKNEMGQNWQIPIHV